MKTKQLVCNDCGCKFEIKDARESTPQNTRDKEVGEGKTGEVSLSCPECRSFNITTA